MPLRAILGQNYAVHSIAQETGRRKLCHSVEQRKSMQDGSLGKLHPEQFFSWYLSRGLRKYGMVLKSQRNTGGLTPWERRRASRCSVREWWRPPLKRQKFSAEEHTILAHSGYSEFTSRPHSSTYLAREAGQRWVTHQGIWPHRFTNLEERTGRASLCLRTWQLHSKIFAIGRNFTFLPRIWVFSLKARHLIKKENLSIRLYNKEL